MFTLMMGTAMLFLGIALLFNASMLDSYIAGTVLGNFWVKAIGYEKTVILHRWILGPLGALCGLFLILSFFSIV